MIVGFDPGGAGAFGWCVAEDSAQLPLAVRACGIANDAADAVAQAWNTLRAGEAVASVGIDAPLFWVAAGDRLVDQAVRTRIVKLGAHGGTVNHVSSMRGACLVQGIIAAQFSRARRAETAITEAHPKAVLWLLGEATPAQRPNMIALRSLSRYFSVGGSRTPSEHERDAALGALSAWAMRHGAKGWTDIRPMEVKAISPIAGQLGYWVPS